MIKINKGSAPQTLIDYKKNKNANYDDFGEKSELKDSLIKEQYGLCAYCMDRISNTISFQSFLMSKLKGT